LWVNRRFVAETGELFDYEIGLEWAEAVEAFGEEAGIED
jgi:hypothetical protein